jgi:hypothetical protein
MTIETEVKSIQAIGDDMRHRRKKIKQEIKDYLDSLKPKKKIEKKELNSQLSIYLLLVMKSKIFKWANFLLAIYVTSFIPFHEAPYWESVFAQIFSYSLCLIMLF